MDFPLFNLFPFDSFLYLSSAVIVSYAKKSKNCRKWRISFSLFHRPPQRTRIARARAYHIRGYTSSLEIKLLHEGFRDFV